MHYQAKNNKIISLKKKRERDRIMTEHKKTQEGSGLPYKMGNFGTFTILLFYFIFTETLIAIVLIVLITSNKNLLNNK